MTDPDATKKILVALHHPVRREMLMRVARQDEPVSPRGLAEQLKMPLSNVSYHARVLAECEVLELVDLKQTKGSLQHFYEPSELMEHPMIKAALDLEDGDANGS
jgi:DNA-binding transcriptional ArsR family regulator